MGDAGAIWANGWLGVGALAVCAALLGCSTPHTGGGDLWLEVGVRRGGGGEPTAVLAIEDSGQGVPEAQRETIFQPFTTTKDRGTGIGLALVREVAEALRSRA